MLGQCEHISLMPCGLLVKGPDIRHSVEGLAGLQGLRFKHSSFDSGI